MNINELISALNEKSQKEITQAEIANWFGCYESNISRRVKNNSEITVSELEKASNGSGIAITELLNIVGKYPDSVEIKYYDGLNISEELIKHAKVDSIWYDKQIVHNVWEKDENNLKCIRMIGDRMQTGEADTINRGDVIIFDTTMTDPLCSGVFVYTAGLEDVLFVGHIEKNLDGSLTFTYRNSNYNKRTKSTEELEELEFKILGRYIKNATRKDI